MNVAVSLVVMVEVPIDQIIHMVAVWDGFMATVGAVYMRGGVLISGVGGAGGGVFMAHLKAAFVDVPLVMVM